MTVAKPTVPSPKISAGTVTSPVECRALADGVYMVPVDDDLVILDLRADAYACLPHAAAAVRIDGATVEADLGLLGLMTETGLVHDAQPRHGRTPPALPGRCVEPRSGWTSILAAAYMLIAHFRIHHLGSGPTVQALIKALPSRPAKCADAARAAAVTAAFIRLMPWAPRQGACLHRAFLLLSMLRRAGVDAVWVFGVRTWPFAAHCWLQMGDAVLDDDPERVSQYAPIMAV